MASSALVTGNKQHGHKVRGHELYETPAVATAALMRAEYVPWPVWEPACGRGAIVDVLRASGRAVLASDLVDYGPLPIGAFWRRDFLMEREAPAGTAAIVTNPPYRLARQFVEHGLELAPIVIMLLRLGFLESAARNGILDGGQLARVHVFRDRLPMMHRDGWEGPTNGSGMAFAWFVWDRAHRGPATIDRISWRTANANADDRVPVPDMCGANGNQG